MDKIHLELVNHVIRRYRECRTYSDFGTIEMVSSNGPYKKMAKLHFSTVFKRPKQLVTTFSFGNSIDSLPIWIVCNFDKVSVGQQNEPMSISHHSSISEALQRITCMRINGGLEFIFDGFTSGIPILLDEELTFGDKNSFDLKSFELYRENELAHENITNGSDTKFWINDNFTITKVTKQDEIGSQSLNEVLELSKWHGLIDLIDQTSLLSTNTSVYSERSFLKVQFDEEISEASFQLN